MVILNGLSHKIITTKSETLGKWYMVTLKGKKGKALTIFNVYKTVDMKITTAGLATIFMQQWKLLRLSDILQSNPQKQFIAYLTEDVAEACNNGSELCILGNFNEVLGKEQGLIISLCISFDLCNTFSKKYPQKSNMSIYSRGTNRLNYVLMSTSMGTPTKISYNPIFHIYNSDHRVMFIDLPIKTRFKQKNSIVLANMREIGSKSKT